MVGKAITLEEKLFGLLFSEARRLLEDASSHI